MFTNLTFPMTAVYDEGELIRMKTAKKAVVQYLTYINFLDGALISTSDIYIVWFCKTLQNWKALLSTDLVDSGIYFEVTYNGDQDELYLDHYTKTANVKIPIQKEHA